MGDHFSEVLDGFLKNLLLFAVVRRPRADLGAGPGPPAPASRQEIHAAPRLTIAYIDVFRAIPLLIMILLISGGIPYLDFLPEDIRIPQWFGQPDPFWYGVLALTIVYGAYMAEVYRAGSKRCPAARWRRRARSG